MEPLLKVARIPYLNCAPFHWRNDPKENDFHWIPVPPKELGRLAKAGKIDAGPVSLVDSFDLEKDFEPLANLGIAVENFAGSVLLFSKRGIQHLGNYQIGLTPDSATSSELLKLILREVYGIAPKFREGFGEEDGARLLIGDAALQKSRDMDFRKTFPNIYDLGEEWRKWKDLPFVFARWMVKKETDEAVKKALARLLTQNVTEARTNWTLAAQWHAQNQGFLPPFPERYLKRFRYLLGEPEQIAVSEFKRLLFSRPAAIAS